MLRKHGLVEMDGHFVRPTRHYSDWVHQERLTQYPTLLRSLAMMIADKVIARSGDAVDAIAGLGTLAYTLAVLTAVELERRRRVDLNEKDALVLTTLIELGPGKSQTVRDTSVLKKMNVLVVDGVVDSGDTVKRTVGLIREEKGTVIGVAAICNRGTTTTSHLGDVPWFEFLAQLDGMSWEPQVCMKRGPCKGRCARVHLPK
jgi:orotate phosphoribosyltransferase